MGKWAAIENVSVRFLNSFGLRRRLKISLFSGSRWNQLHVIEHGSKTDLPIEKRKLCDFGRIISVPNDENRATTETL